MLTVEKFLTTGSENPAIDYDAAHACLYAEVQRACRLRDMAFARADACYCGLCVRNWHGPSAVWYELMADAWAEYVREVYDWYRAACAKLQLTAVTVTRGAPSSEGHAVYAQLWMECDCEPVQFPRLRLAV
jgi:hypothetical protein